MIENDRRWPGKLNEIPIVTFDEPIEGMPKDPSVARGELRKLLQEVDSRLGNNTHVPPGSLSAPEIPIEALDFSHPEMPADPKEQRVAIREAAQRAKDLVW